MAGSDSERSYLTFSIDHTPAGDKVGEDAVRTTLEVLEHLEPAQRIEVASAIAAKAVDSICETAAQISESEADDPLAESIARAAQEMEGSSKRILYYLTENSRS
jgi:hypothetical protein